MTSLSNVPRVLVIGLDGATFDVLKPLADAGVMPNVARLLSDSALAELNSTAPAITPTAWTTFQTGCEPSEHGIFDYRYLEHERGEVLLNHAARVGVPTLFDAVSEAGGDVISLNLPMTWPVVGPARGLIVGGLDSPSLDAVLAPYPDFARRLRESGARYGLDTVWQRRPLDFDELCDRVRATQEVFRGRVVAAQLADGLHDWRLMVVQFQTLDSLQHRAWHLLGIQAAGGPPKWIERTQLAMRTLDACVGELVELAEQRNAAVLVVSDHGFGNFREKISLPELLRRRGLLVPAGAWDRGVYRVRRDAWKVRRWWRRVRRPQLSTASMSRPCEGLLPIDWRRSVALTLHGNLGGLVYLNTPQRFGRGPVATPRQYDQTLEDVIAAFQEARHPETEERLFTDVWAVGDMAGDPIEQRLPDVVAIPAPGFHTRPKMDRSGHLLRPDPALSGTHRQQGVLMLKAPGVMLGAHRAAELRDVAPTILAMLGLRSEVMSGRPLGELFAPDCETPTRASIGKATCLNSASRNVPVAGHQLSAAEKARVEQRLRELGYIE